LRRRGLPRFCQSCYFRNVLLPRPRTIAAVILAAGVLSGSLGLIAAPAAAAGDDPVQTVGLGGRPTGAVISPDGRLAYISNPGANSIDIVDLTTAQLIQSIEVGAGLQSPALNTSGTRLFATTQSDSTLLIIDTATRAIAGRVKVGTQPTMPVISRDGTQLFVANGGSDNVSIIDLISGTLTATVEVGDRPLAPVQGTGSQYSPLDDLLFVTNADASTVSTIDLSTNKIIAEDAVGRVPTRPAVSPFLGVINNEMVISNNGDGNVTILDQARGGSTSSARVGASPGIPVSSIDGTEVFVPNGASASLTVLDIETSPASIKATVPVGKGPTMPLLSPNGRILFVPNTGGTSVTAIDTNSHTVRGSYNVDRGPVSLALSPDAKTLVVPNSGSGTVSVIDLTSQALPFAPPDVTVAPKSKKAKVSWEQSNEIGVTGYIATAIPGGAICTTSGSACTVKGLIGGKKYSFSVQAVNAYGSGAATLSSKIKVRR